MEFSQALPVNGACRQAPRVVGKGQLDTDHHADGNQDRQRAAVSGDTQHMNTTGCNLAAAADLARVPMLAQLSGERLRHLTAAHPVRHFRAGIVSIRPRAIVVLDPAKLAATTGWQSGRAAMECPTGQRQQDEKGSL
jgi:hypothetical protein